MTRRRPPNPFTLEARRMLEEQVALVLAHPGMSDWLKGALRGALERNPVDLMNDLEILNLLLRKRSELMCADDPQPRPA